MRHEAVLPELLGSFHTSYGLAESGLTERGDGRNLDVTKSVAFVRETATRGGVKPYHATSRATAGTNVAAIGMSLGCRSLPPPAPEHPEITQVVDEHQGADRHGAEQEDDHDR